MLSVKNLAITYGQHQAVQNMSIVTEIGEVVVILGANGAGKSSLLRSIAGLCKGRVDGEISFKGQSLLGMSPDEIVTAGIALVPEGRAIFGDLSVEENLTLGAFNSRAREKQMANLDQVLALFPKLRERRRQIARTMSGGEQQMVAIGRALMSDPAILMLDEPSLGLSPLLSQELFQALGKIRETGIGVLVVEQNAKLSLSIADRGYLIENGQLVGENDAASLASDPAVQAAYLGGGGKLAARRPLAPSARLSRPADPPAGKFATDRPAIPEAVPAPSSLQSGTDSDTAGPVAAKHDKVFIKPAGQPTSTLKAEQFLGDDLGQLLSRAARAAASLANPPVPIRQTPAPASGPRTVTISPAPAGDAPSHSARPVAGAADEIKSHQLAAGPNGPVEPDIARLLNDFETAAANARLTEQATANDPVAGSGTYAGPAPRLERGPLPEIPVFKKARVEIFKRDSNGVLAKSREA